MIIILYIEYMFDTVNLIGQKHRRFYNFIFVCLSSKILSLYVYCSRLKKKNHMYVSMYIVIPQGYLRFYKDTNILTTMATGWVKIAHGSNGRSEHETWSDHFTNWISGKKSDVFNCWTTPSVQMHVCRGVCKRGMYNS